MGYETITLDRSGAVAVLTLNVPDRLNACSLQMADEIVAALGGLGDARALLLTGAGRGFCAGADVISAAGATSADEDIAARTYRSLVDHYNPMIRTLAQLELPVVAAVRGPVAGIGCPLALAADLVVASEGAYFLQAFVNIGLVPDGATAWFLSRSIGRARATELAMLGEKLPAPKALQWGLIHDCVAEDVLDRRASELASRLAAMPTRAIGLMKANLRRAFDQTLEEALTAEAEAQREAAATHDAAEGIAAFATKREARFKGA